MSDVQVALVQMEAEHAITPGAPIEQRLREAMKSAANHWMVLDADMQLRGAVAAVANTGTEEEREAVIAEWKALAALSAAMSGLPIDMGQVAMPEKPIGIAGLWREVKHS